MRRLLIHACERLDLGALGRTHRHHHRDVLEDELRLPGHQGANALDRAAALCDGYVEAVLRVEPVLERRIIRRMASERDPVELEQDLLHRRARRPRPYTGRQCKPCPSRGPKECPARGLRTFVAVHGIPLTFRWPRPPPGVPIHASSRISAPALR